MGKQYNKIEKRNRRKRYLERRKAKVVTKSKPTALRKVKVAQPIKVAEKVTLIETAPGTKVDLPEKPNLPKPEICIEQYFGGFTFDVLRIKDYCGANSNKGSLCFRDQKHRHGLVHLDLQIDLINQIYAQGGDFLALPTFPPDKAVEVGSGLHSNHHPAKITHRGESACWGGASYVSWRAYRDVEHAISYLKRYFRVKACDVNDLFTQEQLDACP